MVNHQHKAVDLRGSLYTKMQKLQDTLNGAILLPRLERINKPQNYINWVDGRAPLRRSMLVVAGRRFVAVDALSHLNDIETRKS
jgi:hypothetical protein